MGRGRGSQWRAVVILCVWILWGTSAPVWAGGGGLSGGALEVTQLANNAELMAQVAEAAQQTVQQINMLATMMQNLRDLTDLVGIARRLGIPLGPLADFVRTYQSIKEALDTIEMIKRRMDRFGVNARDMASFYSVIIDELEEVARLKKKLTPEEIRTWMSNMEPDRRRRAQEVLAARFRIMKELEEDYHFIQDNSKEISQITGNVQGLQFLATQQSGIQRLLLDTQLSIQQIGVDMQADRVEQREAEKIQNLNAELLRRDAYEQIAF